MRRSLPAVAGPLLSFFLLLGPVPLGAQFELGPSIGVFVPLGGWTQNFDGDQVERRQLAASLLTGRASYWFGPIGVEAMLGYAPSQVAVSTVGRTQDITSGVVLGSARALAHLGTVMDGQPGPARAQWDFFGGAGIGFVARGGSAWANHTGTTHPAAVLNLEARTPLSGPITVRLMLEDFISRPTFNRGQPGESRARMHHDLLFTFMGVFRLGARR